jgi:hypothetical protein
MLICNTDVLHLEQQQPKEVSNVYQFSVQSFGRSFAQLFYLLSALQHNDPDFLDYLSGDGKVRLELLH